jgi:hypothetical protein
MSNWLSALLSAGFTLMGALLFANVRAMYRIKAQNKTLSEANANMAKALETHYAEQVRQARYDGIAEGRKRTIYAGACFGDKKERRDA